MTAPGPSRSAMLVAACRALADEQEPQERIVSDPVAWSLVDEQALNDARNDPALQRGIRLRTRYIDDRIVDFCEDHPGATVLLLGAGLDARAYRLAVDARFIEMDMPASVEGKQRLLDLAGASAPNRRAVGVDLTTTRVPPALQDCGFDTAIPAFVAWEGVVFYLDEGSAAQVVADLGEVLAPGSEIVFDYVELPNLSDADWAHTKQIGRSLRTGGEALRSGLRDVRGHLDRAGFEVLDDEIVELLAPRYGLEVGPRKYPARILHARRR